MARLPADLVPRRSPRWLEVVGIVLGVRAGFLLIASAANWLMTPQGGTTEPFIELWNNWDVRHFIEIATFGYTDPRTDPNAAAFFPAFPLLTRAVASIGIPAVIAGMLISTVATAVAAGYLYRLADDDAGSGAGRRAVLYLVLFPTAVFLVAPYSEALFLAGAIPAFYYARRNRWLAASFPAALAVATRAAGIFLMLGLAVEFLRRNRPPRRHLAVGIATAVIALAPLIAYGVYMHAATGNAFQFLVDQREGWDRELTPPWTAFATTWEAAFTDRLAPNFQAAFMGELVAVAAGLAVVVWAAARREWGYVAYMGSLLAVLMTSVWYLSVPRILLTFFPALVFLAGATRRRPLRHELLVVVFAALATLGVVVFTAHSWFY
jgi:Mannosyltransferase (PIG-V)